VLGSGIAGIVRKVTHRITSVNYAVKTIELSNVDNESSLQQLREEIYIMCQLDHPNVVRLEEVYESHQQIYLVQELCLGGELFDRLDEQPDYHYTEQQCARLVNQMLCAVRYIHSKGIIHRDLKLENFLFSSEDADSELKMIDFGLSKHFALGETQSDPVGTPYTVAPEVIRGKYDNGCDVWAIGVITYLLLCGDPPFGGCGGPESLIQVRNNILGGTFKFKPEDIWAAVSDRAKEFILHVLQVDPNKRPTAQEAQDHPWLLEENYSTHGHQLNPKVVKSLVAFKEYSDMRKLLCEVLSFTMLPEQLRSLRSEFEKLDVDGSGEISLGSLKRVLMQNASLGSLGAFTEEEVEDIFNAMRVGKKETTIHWHEFIAAGLSQCAVDDRNLKIAFERLDSEHKGYITLENITDVMGGDATEDSLRDMFAESLEACKSQEHITYEDFLLLMKGQTKEGLQQQSPATGPIRPSENGPIPPDLFLLPPRSKSNNSDENYNFNTFNSLNKNGLPTTDEDRDMNIGLSMDEDDVEDELHLLVPLPALPDGIIDEQIVNTIPNFIKPVERHRSRSYDNNDSKQLEDIADMMEASQKIEKPADFDITRAVLLPERHKSLEKTRDSSVERAGSDKGKTSLSSNRELYRAHRIMRMAVTEASKRFEENQRKRTLQAIAKENGIPLSAGLVMRRGAERQISSTSIRAAMRRQDAERKKRAENAIRKGGRNRRKKTVSDMSAMMSPAASLLAQQSLPNRAVTSDKPDVSIPQKDKKVEGSVCKSEFPTSTSSGKLELLHQQTDNTTDDLPLVPLKEI